MDVIGVALLRMDHPLEEILYLDNEAAIVAHCLAAGCVADELLCMVEGHRWIEFV